MLLRVVTDSLHSFSFRVQEQEPAAAVTSQLHQEHTEHNALLNSTDANHDEVIDRQEYDKYVQRHHAQQQQQQQESSSGADKLQAAALLKVG